MVGSVGEPAVEDLGGVWSGEDGGCDDEAWASEIGGVFEEVDVVVGEVLNANVVDDNLNLGEGKCKEEY